MKKLRLLLTDECDRHCDGCCNKGIDLEALPVCTDFTPYDEILITGGEPLLCPTYLINCIEEIRGANPKAHIILYTACTENPMLLLAMARLVDSITLTLHDAIDTLRFVHINKLFIKHDARKHRLNVFATAMEGIIGGLNASPFWKVKDNIEWIKDAPLPDGEVFMRY